MLINTFLLLQINFVKLKSLAAQVFFTLLIESTAYLHFQLISEDTQTFFIIVSEASTPEELLLSTAFIFKTKLLLLGEGTASNSWTQISWSLISQFMSPSFHQRYIKYDLSLPDTLHLIVHGLYIRHECYCFQPKPVKNTY